MSDAGPPTPGARSPAVEPTWSRSERAVPRVFLRPLQEFLAALVAEGITPVSLGYVGLHHTPAIRNAMQAGFGLDPQELHLPCTDQAAGQTLWIAQNALLGTPKDMQDILTAVEKIRRAWGS